MTTNEHNPYEHHVLVQPTTPDPTRLYLRSPTGGSEFWCEFVFCRSGTLLVHGDGPDFLFRRWGNDKTLRSEIEMVARGDKYAASKCVLGQKRVWDDAVARATVFDWLVTEITEGDDTAGHLDQPTALTKARDTLDEWGVEWDDEHVAKHALYDARPDWWEDLGALGMVESTDWQHVVLAARRALALLDQGTSP